MELDVTAPEVRDKTAQNLFQSEILEYKKLRTAGGSSPSSGKAKEVDPSGAFIRLLGLLYIRFTTRNYT